MVMVETMKEALAEEHGGGGGGDAGSVWSDLHQPLLELVLSKLPISDYFRSGTVCRWWLEARRSATLSTSGVHPPWLLLPRLSSNSLFSPAERATFGFNNNNNMLLRSVMAGLVCTASSHGWLLMTSIFGGDDPNPRLLNPFTGSIVPLPPYNIPTRGGAMALSAPPTHWNCVVTVAARNGGFAFCRPWSSSPAWEEVMISDETAEAEQMMMIESLVFCGGRFYGLAGADFGQLVVLDTNEDDDSSPPNPSGARKKLSIDRRSLPSWWRTKETGGVLVESDGDLLLVFLCNLSGKCDAGPGPAGGDVEVQVFRLDFQMMRWVRVCSLGRRALFISRQGSVSVPAAADRVYYARPWLSAVVEQDHPWATTKKRWEWMEYDLSGGEAAAEFHHHHHHVVESSSRVGGGTSTTATAKEYDTIQNFMWLSPTLA